MMLALWSRTPKSSFSFADCRPKNGHCFVTALSPAYLARQQLITRVLRFGTSHCRSLIRSVASFSSSRVPASAGSTCDLLAMYYTTSRGVLKSTSPELALNIVHALTSPLSLFAVCDSILYSWGSMALGVRPTTHSQCNPCAVTRLTFEFRDFLELGARECRQRAKLRCIFNNALQELRLRCEPARKISNSCQVFQTRVCQIDRTLVEGFVIAVVFSDDLQ